MSHKKYFTLGLLPMLGLMMMSPSIMTNKKHVGRSLAVADFQPSDMQKRKQELEQSVATKKEEFPKYKVISDRLLTEHPHQANNELERAPFIQNLEGIVSLIEDEKRTIESELKDLAKIREASTRIEGEIHAITQAEKNLQDLEARNLIKADDDKKPRDLLTKAKKTLEELLTSLETAKVALEKPEVKPAEVVVVVAEPAKPEVAVEEKKEVSSEDKKEARTKRKKEKEEKSELEQILCDLRDQNKAMNENMQKLIADQSSIMQQMMSMMQNMMNMQAFQQKRAESENLYQYRPQFPQGNWMFTPEGYQPSTSIFGSMAQTQNFYTPQLGGQTPTFNAGQNQSAVTSGSWSLRPDQNLQFVDPRLVPNMAITPGDFGGLPQDLGSFGFDFSQPQIQPQELQAQPFTPQQIPFIVPLPSTSPRLGGPEIWA